MRRSDDFDPARNRQFVGAELPADVVIQDLSSCAGDAAEPFVFHHLKVIAQGQAGLQHAVVNFHWRKRVNMHGGKNAFDGAQEIAVKKTIQIAPQATLNADFGRAAIPGFLRTANDFLKRERVGICGLGPAPKSAKAAANKADVGEVDVAIDYVGDGLAYSFAPQVVRYRHQSLQVRAFGSCQMQALLEKKFFAAQNCFERFARARRA